MVVCDRENRRGVKRLEVMKYMKSQGKPPDKVRSGACAKCAQYKPGIRLTKNSKNHGDIVEFHP
jgi:hypothetical protein